MTLYYDICPFKIRTLNEIMKVRLIPQLFSGHSHHFAIITPYAHFFATRSAISRPPLPY